MAVLLSKQRVTVQDPDTSSVKDVDQLVVRFGKGFCVNERYALIKALESVDWQVQGKNKPSSRGYEYELVMQRDIDWVGPQHWDRALAEMRRKDEKAEAKTRRKLLKSEKKSG